jgi:hypothetical protein
MTFRPKEKAFWSEIGTATFWTEFSDTIFQFSFASGTNGLKQKKNDDSRRNNPEKKKRKPFTQWRSIHPSKKHWNKQSHKNYDKYFGAKSITLCS